MKKLAFEIINKSENRLYIPILIDLDSGEDKGFSIDPHNFSKTVK